MVAVDVLALLVVFLVIHLFDALRSAALACASGPLSCRRGAELPQHRKAMGACPRDFPADKPG